MIVSAQSEQSDVIAFLANPSSTPGGPVVERVETHGNIIFLAAEEAWKIKRAVRFPYMDFSTLERRRAACEAELEVNRRLAPELYLDVVPITRERTGGLALGGTGEVIEWAVHMRRFRQEDLLSARCPASIPDEDAQRVADAVLASHEAASVSGAIDGHARLQRLLQALQGALTALPDLPRSDVAAWAAHAGSRLDTLRQLLDKRAQKGFVRRCHGDLHAANIVFWQDRPMLFDAIEFDPELATIDIFYDLGFLLMDLWRRGARRAANQVLNRYLWRSGRDDDLEALRLLPLFMSLRAAVRALVTAERAEQEHDEGRRRDDALAQDLLQLARAILAPHPARLVAVSGLSGTGKSTLARGLACEIAPQPGAIHLRTDLVRKSLAGVPETERLAAASYTPQASEQVYVELLRQADLALAAGATVILDAVAARPSERDAFAALAAKHAVPFDGLWLSGPGDTLAARVRTRRNDASDATDDVVRAQLAWDVGALTPAWHEIDASGPAATTQELALRALMRTANLDKRTSP